MSCSKKHEKLLNASEWSWWSGNSSSPNSRQMKKPGEILQDFFWEKWLRTRSRPWSNWYASVRKKKKRKKKGAWWGKWGRAHGIKLFLLGEGYAHVKLTSRSATCRWEKIKRRGQICIFTYYPIYIIAFLFLPADLNAAYLFSFLENIKNK